MIFKHPENNAILVSEDLINWQEATIADVYAELVKSLKENEELKKYNNSYARLLKTTKSVIEREIALNKEKIDKLKQKLEICKNALKKYSKKSEWTEGWDNEGHIGLSCVFYQYGYETAEEALKKIEELKQDD